MESRRLENKLKFDVTDSAPFCTSMMFVCVPNVWCQCQCQCQCHIHFLSRPCLYFYYYCYYNFFVWHSSIVSLSKCFLCGHFGSSCINTMWLACVVGFSKTMLKCTYSNGKHNCFRARLDFNANVWKLYIHNWEYVCIHIHDDDIKRQDGFFMSVLFFDDSLFDAGAHTSTHSCKEIG